MNRKQLAELEEITNEVKGLAGFLFMLSDTFNYAGSTKDETYAQCIYNFAKSSRAMWKQLDSFLDEQYKVRRSVGT